jgi:GntR family transcriptional regulator/MocR family aminotransferase
MTTTTTQLRGVTNLISVDRRLAKPLYRQIYDAFRARVLRGELRAGQLVPSTRELARDLRVSRLPVLDAYAQLHAEGYFETRVGAGTFIAGSLSGPSDARPPIARGERPLSARAVALPPYETHDAAGMLGPFQLGQPDLHSFPIEIWSKLTARYSRRMRVKALQYGDPMGLPELREVIAHYLRTSRGVRCEASQIMIVSGSQQALDLSTRVLLDPGAAAWVEDPGYWLVQQVLQSAGCKAVPVPVDDEGLDVAAGIAMRRKPRAVFVAPSHQYPLGVTMSVTRRLQLLEWAQRAGAWVIEDDYDSEYRYDSMPVASLQGLDEDGRVIYIGTFSKVMFPSLRLGYVVMPPDLVPRFAAVRRAMDLCPAHSTQAVMADFMREGHFARHIRRMRPVYAQRRRLLVEHLQRELGDLATVIGDAAGMHLTMFLEGCGSDREIVRRAAQQSLLLSALSALYLGPDARQGLVLGFGNTRENQIAGAVRQLKKIIREAGHRISR